MTLFKYDLPGGLSTNTYLTLNGDIKFEPPVYEQRYSTALRILEDDRWNTTFKKIVDFGCAEMNMLPLVRRIETVEHILEVDTNAALLKMNQQKAMPLVSDYLRKREKPLRVEILAGSIDTPDELLHNADAVLVIEVIEHLEANVLANVPQNIFGFIQPKLVLITTPNIEFNVLFGGPLHPNGLRHEDHKFEWTRREFKNWALNICKNYPNYMVSIFGVGKAPPDHKELGCSTQIALFVRKDVQDESLVQPLTNDIPATTDADLKYKEILAVDFPCRIDERNKEEKIYDEVRYQLNSLHEQNRFFNSELNNYQIPLKILLKNVEKYECTLTELRNVLLANNYVIEQNNVVLPKEEVDNNLSYRHYDDTFDVTIFDDDDFLEEMDRADTVDNNKVNAVEYESEENWD